MAATFDGQFEPYPARLWWRPRGVAWDAVPESMVENINPNFLKRQIYAQAQTMR
jgi:hypothetical protein